VTLLKSLIYATLLLIATVLAIGLVLPKSAHVERSISTAAGGPTIYGIVSGFKRFNEWSPWFGLDPQTRYTYAGPESGVGAKMTWTSEKRAVGSGSQEVLAVEPGRRVRTKLDFASQGSAISTITIAPEGTGSRITWAFDASYAGDFFGRYFGLLLDRFVGRDYERGLVKLKALAEASAPEPRRVESTAPSGLDAAVPSSAR